MSKVTMNSDYQAGGWTATEEEKRMEDWRWVDEKGWNLFDALIRGGTSQEAFNDAYRQLLYHYTYEHRFPVIFDHIEAPMYLGKFTTDRNDPDYSLKLPYDEWKHDSSKKDTAAQFLDHEGEPISRENPTNTPDLPDSLGMGDDRLAKITTGQVQGLDLDWLDPKDKEFFEAYASHLATTNIEEKPINFPSGVDWGTYKNRLDYYRVQVGGEAARNFQAYRNPHGEDFINLTEGDYADFYKDYGVAGTEDDLSKILRYSFPDKDPFGNIIDKDTGTVLVGGQIYEGEDKAEQYLQELGYVKGEKWNRSLEGGLYKTTGEWYEPDSEGNPDKAIYYLDDSVVRYLDNAADQGAGKGNLDTIVETANNYINDDTFADNLRLGRSFEDTFQELATIPWGTPEQSNIKSADQYDPTNSEHIFIGGVDTNRTVPQYSEKGFWATAGFSYDPFTGKPLLVPAGTFNQDAFTLTPQLKDSFNSGDISLIEALGSVQSSNPDAWAEVFGDNDITEWYNNTTGLDFDYDNLDDTTIIEEAIESSPYLNQLKEDNESLSEQIESLQGASEKERSESYYANPDLPSNKRVLGVNPADRPDLHIGFEDTFGREGSRLQSSTKEQSDVSKNSLNTVDQNDDLNSDNNNSGQVIDKSSPVISGVSERQAAPKILPTLPDTQTNKDVVTTDINNQSQLGTTTNSIEPLNDNKDNIDTGKVNNNLVINKKDQNGNIDSADPYKVIDEENLNKNKLLINNKT